MVYGMCLRLLPKVRGLRGQLVAAMELTKVWKERTRLAIKQAAYWKKKAKSNAAKTIAVKREMAETSVVVAAKRRRKASTYHRVSISGGAC